MDIYDYLKMDHQKISNLFDQFESSSLLIRKKQIVDMIMQELTVHAKSEEKTFYTILESHPESKEITNHAKKEHKEIEDKINSIRLAENLPGWEQEVRDFKKIVKHHVGEEEGAMFREAKKIISKEQSYGIKEKMHNLKMGLLLDYKKTGNSGSQLPK